MIAASAAGGAAGAAILLAAICCMKKPKKIIVKERTEADVTVNPMVLAAKRDLEKQLAARENQLTSQPTEPGTPPSFEMARQKLRPETETDADFLSMASASDEEK